MVKYSDEIDPKGLIYEAYRIPNISKEDCRTIFFDWALSLDPGKDLILAVRSLHHKYKVINNLHPMTLVLQEGLKEINPNKKKRRHRKRN